MISDEEIMRKDMEREQYKQCDKEDSHRCPYCQSGVPETMDDKKLADSHKPGCPIREIIELRIFDNEAIAKEDEEDDILEMAIDALSRICVGHTHINGYCSKNMDISIASCQVVEICQQVLSKYKEMT